MRCVWFIIPIMATAGCGDRLGTVTGTVTLDGQPLAGGPQLRAIVEFVPESGGASATGYLDAAGKYRLSTGSQDGIAPGRYLVAVSASKIIPAAIPGEAASGRPVTPRRYASPKDSGLTADVESGQNTVDFALKSAASP